MFVGGVCVWSMVTFVVVVVVGVEQGGVLTAAEVAGCVCFVFCFEMVEHVVGQGRDVAVGGGG